MDTSLQENAIELIRRVFFWTICLVSLIVLSLTGWSQSGEEFSGEFASWANVKKRFGARGDGKTDDTKALQKAIDSLSVRPTNFNAGSSGYTTLYLPAGNYRITASLVLRGKIGVNIIGEDPQNTIITWGGKEGQTMLWANGSAYYKISRISWNGDNKASIVGIGLKWRSKWNENGSQSYASLNIEISDCYFVGKLTIGIAGGTFGGDDGTGANDSEVAIQRCYFTDCVTGISITGYNALDYWIWDCRFIRCLIGVRNSHGNYHAYRCFFEQTKGIDFENNNGYYTSVRGCYTVQTNRFSFDHGASCNPFKRIFQGNFVNPITGTSVHYPHIGKPVFLDNTFTKPTREVGDNVLYYATWCKGISEVLSVGNKYSMTRPLRLDGLPQKIFTINDQKGFSGDLPISREHFLKSQQPMPVRTTRKTFEVPKNASASEIQRLINNVHKLVGERPIVHFGFGVYILNKQLVIPAGSDVQLIGDGLIYASVLKKAPDFPKGTSMLKVLGPSDIVVRDLQIADHDGSVNDIAGIEFVNVDQPGSTAFIDQLYSSANTAIEMVELDHMYVQKQNSFFTPGNRVSGGKLVQQGKGTAGLYSFGGQFADLTVTNNGKFVSKDCWWEGPLRKPLDLSGSGDITIDGFMIAPAGVDGKPSISINKFSGRISLMNGYLQGGIFVTPENSQLNLLVWNIHFYHAMQPTGFISNQSNFKGAFLGLSTQCFDNTNRECGQILSKEDRLVNVKNENNFILEMVNQTRSAVPRRYLGKKAGSSTILLSRVSIGNSKTAIRFLK